MVLEQLWTTYLVFFTVIIVISFLTCIFSKKPCCMEGNLDSMNNDETIDEEALAVVITPKMAMKSTEGSEGTKI